MQASSKALFFFGLACLFLAGILFWQRTTPTRLKFNIDNLELNPQENLAAPMPKALIIEDLGIKLDIYPQTIINGNWPATDKGVSYLSTTAIPGDIGNSVLYGHNWKNLLGNVVKIKPSQLIKIIFSDGSVKKFEVKYTQVVTSDQTQILNNSEDARITLYTCIGFMDTKRFVVTAILNNKF